MLDKLIFIFLTDNMIYRGKVIILAIMLIGDISFGLMYIYQISDLMINPFFRIGFIIIYSNSMRNSANKLALTLTKSYPAILVASLNLVVFGSIAYVMFYNEVGYFDQYKFFSYNFSSINKSIFTLFIS
jgi:hypothetical protein